MSKYSCPQPFDCDFENPEYDLCSWTNVNSSYDNFDWQIKSSNDQTNFGLIADNTFEDLSGHFMLSNGKILNHFSRLISENMPSTSSTGDCLSFYYYFNGGSGVNMTIRLAEYNKAVTTLWTLRDDQAIVSRWNFGQLYFSTKDTYRVYIDGYAGSNGNHFVGVDDIVLKPSTGVCNFVPIEAITILTTPGIATTTITPNIPPHLKELDCDFESDCKWKQSNPLNSYINWVVLNASALNNGPSIDHTLGTNRGSFVSPIIKNYSPYTSGYYESPTLNFTACLQFWYFIRGSEVNKN